MPDPTSPIPPADFLNFLSGLASQGLMQLGCIPNPLSGRREVNLAFARYTCDLLQVLKVKTAGNRTPEEDRYLEGILADLTHQLQTREEPSA